MSVRWAVVDRTRWGLQGKHHLCGCGRKGGCKARCPQASWPSGPRWKRSPAPSSLETSMSKHVGKEAGSQHFGFTRTRHPELEGPYWAAGPVPTPPRTGLLLTVAVWPMWKQPRFLWLFLHLVQTHHHPVFCKELKNKFKKVGLVNWPGSLETSSEESLQDIFYFKWFIQPTTPSTISRTNSQLVITYAFILKNSPPYNSNLSWWTFRSTCWDLFWSYQEQGLHSLQAGESSGYQFDFGTGCTKSSVDSLSRSWRCSHWHQEVRGSR